MPCGLLPSSVLFSRLFELAAIEPTFSCQRFLLFQVSSVSHIASTPLVQFLTLIRLSSALSDPIPRLPHPGSGSYHDTTVALGRRVLRLRLLVTRWCHPSSRVFRPGDFLYNTLIYILVPVFSPVPASIASPTPTLALILVIVFSPVPTITPVAVTVFFLPCLVPCPPLGTVSTGRCRVLCAKLLATYRRHLLSTEMTLRVECKRLVINSVSLSM